MPESDVFSYGLELKNHIGGLLSHSISNSYSQFFTGIIHSFTWADGYYYTSREFYKIFVGSCPAGCSLSNCRKGSNLCLITNQCGNGVRDSGETCDDNNKIDGDGCSSSCAVETGYGCKRSDLTSSNPDVCALLCGDGALDQSETCDDSNASSGDGCSSNCNVEDGYTCSRSGNTAASPDICVAAGGSATSSCGNGVIDPGEECDDELQEDYELCHLCSRYFYKVTDIKLDEEN